jgi:hypothetical protein
MLQNKLDYHAKIIDLYKNEINSWQSQQRGYNQYPEAIKIKGERYGYTHRADSLYVH